MDTGEAMEIQAAKKLLEGQKPASRFDSYHRAGGILTQFPKDRSLLLCLIPITEKVETLLKLL